MNLSEYHEELLDIVFKRVLPGSVAETESLHRPMIDETALELMSKLVKVEFDTSLRKEINSVDEGLTMVDPHPYDVFLVESTFTNNNISIAVCVPMRRKSVSGPMKKKSELELMWYDENDQLWSLGELRATRKVASLSGTVRVLENLQMPQRPILMQQAMKRENVRDVDVEVGTIRDDNKVNALNTSQAKAVAMLKSGSFNSGFFVIQGPPGCGKTTVMVNMIAAANERVVVCAPSNAATANIALKLIEKSNFDVSQLCVYGLNCHPSVRFLNPTIRIEEYRKFVEKYNELSTKKQKINELRRFSTWLHLDPTTSYRDIQALFGAPAHQIEGNEDNEFDFPYADNEECELTNFKCEKGHTVLERLHSFVLSLAMMKVEGFPLNIDDGMNRHDSSSDHSPIFEAARRYEMRPSEEFTLLFDPITSYELVEDLRVPVGDLEVESDTDMDPSHYVQTCLSRAEVSDESSVRVYAIDCEMVKTTSERPELARVTLLQFRPTDDNPERYAVVLDILVKPRNQILDYLTQYSGITASLLANVTTRLEEVQASLLAIICKDDILVGQSLENDLLALQLVHMKVVDTAHLFATGRRKHSLKRLSACLLDQEIQGDSSIGHCSEEDASAALLLAVRRARFGKGYNMYGKGSLLGGLDKDMVYSADVVLCTLNSSGSQWLRNNAGDRQTFFLDEGGQCNEAEFYLATTYPGIRRVVVVGDPMQLPATVIDPRCKNAGFGKSWMENVQRLHPGAVHLLDTQYRMDPEILKFPNKCFYRNRIKSGESVRFRLPQLSNPVGFVDTSNESSQERELFSWKNTHEANLIRALFRQDDDIKTLLREGRSISVVVITPYNAQATLLKNELKKVKGLHNWSVSTVDSFQGQEADIVIISTVRTKGIGFVDDRQRLNVALTRAKRVVRIVGCKNLFRTFHNQSTLRKLTAYTENEKFKVAVKLKNNVYSLPDWREPSVWTATLTQRFHNCLKPMDFKHKAVTLRTLQTVVAPNVRALYDRPRKNSFWQISSLPGHPYCSIVWVAKGKGMVIEAHFAASREKCFTFIQRNQSNYPSGSCKVKPDLSGTSEGMLKMTDFTSNSSSSWKLSNFIQKAIDRDEIEELPGGFFHLDPEQRLIVDSPPPLLIESRSGTGKTNVLFQHAIKMCRDLSATNDTKPVAFITVSKRLCLQLQKMYSGMKDIDVVAIQSCAFISLSDLLAGLAKRYEINWDVGDLVTFKEFLRERKSHTALPVDQALVENEIGGVIMGSLRSAELRRPLTWREYEDDIRSNISNKDAEGNIIRRAIYDQFKSYQRWKKDNALFDINDMVLEILLKLGGEKQQWFSGVYLDEVQDFSYAMIYLVCSIGGTSTMSWIFAGDTAQMISPGCSFKFAGLKQTLLSIKAGIENHLKKVDHLLVNYRTTKHVLEVGNAILSKAKENFPGVIEFARKEQAVNDFGLPVVLMDWEEAMTFRPSFGRDQALVYSFSTQVDISVSSLKSWLGGHPFILSVLDSKGLEFDDVVVAFNLDRASFKLDSKEMIALAMLRELYVAVTRAKRRVIILVKKKSDTMLTFLSHLGCKYHPNPVDLLNEFNTCTSQLQWVQRADSLFKDERFDVASRCYEKANDPGMTAWARGKDFAQKKEKTQAWHHLIQASQIFYENEDHKKVLDIAKDLIEVVSWSENPPNFMNEKIFGESIAKHPRHLTQKSTVDINMFRDNWQGISLTDIENNAKSVQKRRSFSGLIAFLQTLNENELARLSNTIPCIVGDMYYYRKQYLAAIRLYHVGGDFDKADSTSEEMVHQLRKSDEPSDLLKLLALWEPYRHHLVKQGVSRSLKLLNDLLTNPQDTAKEKPDQCLEILGHRVISFIIRYTDSDATLLHSFCKNSFHDEVLSFLKKQNTTNLEEVVLWFVSHDDEEHALSFISERISQWDIKDLHLFVSKDLLSENLAEEFSRRKLHFDAVVLYIKLKKVTMAMNCSSDALSSIKDAEQQAYKIALVLSNANILKKATLPRIKLLKELFYEPENMEKTQCSECTKIFGSNVVKEFVIRRGPYFKDKESEYIDILDVLKKFGRTAAMSRSTVLQHIRKYKINANSFIDFHMKKWTMTELSNLVTWGYHTDFLADEFMLRHHYIMATKLYLREKRYDDAVKASDCALSTPTSVAKHAVELESIWSNKKYDITLKKLSERSSVLSLFLLLWHNPLRASSSHSEDCFRRFGSTFVRKAVLRSAPYKKPHSDGYEDELSILKRFDINANVNTDGFHIVEHYVNEKDYASASRFVTMHLTEWSNSHMMKIYNSKHLKIPCLALADELFIRNIFHPAAVKYYESCHYDSAADASNNDLLSQNMVDTTKANVALCLWHPYIEEFGYTPLLQSREHLALLLDLFHDPYTASANRNHDVRNCFQPSVIQEAVLSHYSRCSMDYYDPYDLLQHLGGGDTVTSKLDTLSALKKINKAAAERYAICNLEFWSNHMGYFTAKQLSLFCSLSSEARPIHFVRELEKRQMFLEAAHLHLEASSFQKAISSSNSALATVKLAQTNANGIIDIWNKTDSPKDSVHKLIPPTCKLWLLLNLFRDPTAASELGSIYMKAFGANVVLEAVKRKIKVDKVGDILLKFDNKAFRKKASGKTRSGRSYQ